MKAAVKKVAPLYLRKSKNVEVEDVSSALTSAEYSSIREESIQSFATSQSIIQWSLATYGVLFGAGLLAANGDIDSNLVESVTWMAALIYGLLLPGLVCAAAWSWIGEIRRMERTGVYVRGLERRLRAQTERSRSSVVGPLNWESFLAGNQEKGAPSVKGWTPYLGTAMLFGGGVISSVVFFYIWLDRLFTATNDHLGVWALVAVDSLLVILFLVVCIVTGLGVVDLGNRYFDFQSQTIRTIKQPRVPPKTVKAVLLSVIALCGAVAYLVFLPDNVLTWRDGFFAWLGIY